MLRAWVSKIRTTSYDYACRLHEVSVKAPRVMRAHRYQLDTLGPWRLTLSVKVWSAYHTWPCLSEFLMYRTITPSKLQATDIRYMPLADCAADLAWLVSAPSLWPCCSHTWRYWIPTSGKITKTVSMCRKTNMQRPWHDDLITDTDLPLQATTLPSEPHITNCMGFSHKMRGSIAYSAHWPKHQPKCVSGTNFCQCLNSQNWRYIAQAP